VVSKNKKNRNPRTATVGAAEAFKNRVRGAVAALKTVPTGNKAEKKWISDRRAVGALNRTLNDARRKLSPGALRTFEAWADEFTRAQLQAETIGTTPSLLGVLPTKPPVISLAAALRSAHQELGRARRLLQRYCEQTVPLHGLVLAGNWIEAGELIDKISAEFGHSYWAIEAKIAVHHYSSDPDRARHSIQRFSAGGPGLNRFYFYHFGLRGEPSQSSTRFRALVAKRLSDSKLEKHERIYALYRATGALPENPDELVPILSFDQLTTRIDLLHTAMKVAARLLVSSARQPRDVIEAASDLVKDFREPLFASLFGNKDGRVVPEVTPHLRSSLTEALESILSDTEAPPDGVTARGLASLITFHGSEANEEQFRKFLLNFNWLPEGIYLVEHPRVSKIAEILAAVKKGPAARLGQPLDEELRGQLSSKLSDAPDEDGLKKLATAGINPAELIVNSQPIWARADFSALLVECLAIDGSRTAIEEGDDAIAVAICANAPLVNPRLVAGLPFADLFGGRNWKRVAAYGPSLELCCSLHQYLTLNDERQIRTFKRFAIEDLMRATRTSSVLELCRHLTVAHPNLQLVEYFLSTVCDLPTLELLPGIDGSRQALKARSDILRIASKISANSSAQLISEADVIDSQLEVDSALDVLDDSKVYVDEEPLLVQASKELAPDFERYKQLVAAGIGEAASLEELFRNVRQQSATVFQIPKNEAEDLLLQMLDALRAKFIDDRVNGLDSVIGRRIRHGTVSDELRGTLEHLNMIGQRPRTGADYDAPGMAIEIGQDLEPRLRKAVNSAFARFSLSIDQLVAQLRDEVFRSAPSGKLKPAFELMINPFSVAVARSVASQCDTVAQFARECFQLFWFSLSPVVERDRPVVDDFIKKSLRDIFGKLSHELRNIGVTDATALARVQHASEQLQYKASLISSWIRVPRLNLEGKTYPLPLVFDVALAFVKSKRSGFEPTVTARIDDSVRLDPHGFPLVHDALQIALDNIAQHSGIKVGNPVEVVIGLSENRKLVFDLRSDVAKGAWTKERAQKFEQIKEDIARKNYERARKDRGGSGLTRLAGIVHQGTDSKFAAEIEVGDDATLRFTLHFELLYIPLDHIGSGERVSVEVP
jgi:hypothetical protein